MTLHPQEGKRGVNISKGKYDVIKSAILASLRANEGMTFKDLTEDVARELEGRFDGSISWYVITVKLDLEARGVIERVPQMSPQRLRIVKG